MIAWGPGAACGATACDINADLTAGPVGSVAGTRAAPAFPGGYPILATRRVRTAAGITLTGDVAAGDAGRCPAAGHLVPQIHQDWHFVSEPAHQNMTLLELELTLASMPGLAIFLLIGSPKK